MPDKQKRKATAKKSQGAVVPENCLPEITENNEVFSAAIRRVRQIVEAHIESHSEEPQPGPGTLAGMAAAFLLAIPSLLLIIERGTRDEAIEAAICLGLSARIFFATSPGKTATGKTIFEVLNAYEGHAKGGDNTKLLESDEDWQQFKEVLDMCRTGNRHNYKEVAGKLFSRGIKGPKGRRMSEATVGRLRKELEEGTTVKTDVRFLICSDNCSVVRTLALRGGRDLNENNSEA